MNVDESKAVRRIVVALDACSRRTNVLQEAAELAAKLRAELQGLFVEDDRLLRLAALPFAREVASGSAAVRRLDLSAVEQMLRAKSRQVQGDLVEAAQRVRVRWSFETTRGDVTRTSLQATRAADVVLMGREQPGLHPLLPTPSTKNQRPVAVVYDGTPAAFRALALAAEVTPERDDRIVVILLSDDADEARRFRGDVESWLRREALPTAGLLVTPVRVTDLAKTCNACHCRMTMLGASSEVLRETGLEQLLDLVDCPLALIR